MKPRRRAWWVICAVGAAVVAGALIPLTALTLALEQSESEARADAIFQKSLREALLAMDSWLAPQLEIEARRPPFEYRAFYPQERAYNRLMALIRPGEVVLPSPLITYRSELFRLHFQLDQDGNLSSPQVPTGNFRDLVEGQVLVSTSLDTPDALLREIAPRLTFAALQRQVDRAEIKWQEVLGDPQTIDDFPEEIASNDLGKARTNISWRAKTNPQQEGQQARQQMAQIIDSGFDQVESFEEAPHVGPLVPIWLAEGPRDLLFVRQIRQGGRHLLQGIVSDWPELESRMLAQIDEIFPVAALRPVDAESLRAEESAHLLGTIPAVLEVTPNGAPSSTWPPSRWALVMVWTAVLLAIAWFGITLKRSFEDAERRRRFASAVTHELRTPLTTFRMYSEMLAEGMVSDAEKVAVYLQTLKKESARLAMLVENVLGYARLEDGRLPDRRERVTPEALLERTLPNLQTRAAEAGLQLEIEGQGDLSAPDLVHTNVEATEQILFNLVDNACKYAATSTERHILLQVSGAQDHLEIALRDFGPGIPPPLAERIFQPFDRGDRAEADPAPGIGLGLALARGLARDQGGDLRLDPACSPGSRFVLRLPA